MTRLFADDSSISTTSIDLNLIETEINIDLIQLSKWDREWLVIFNPDKTDVMLFTNRFFHQYPKLEFDNKQLSFVDEHKHLGLTFSVNAKWDRHIETMIKKCSKMVGVLRRLKMNLSRKCLSTMYLSFIGPILEYADIAWDGCSNDATDRLEKIQTEAARLVTGLTRSSNLNALYNEVGWCRLSQRRKERKLITFYKIVHGLAPSYLTDLLPPYVGYDMPYNLRNQFDYIEPLCRLEIYKKSFFPSTISLWNALPNDVRNLPNLSAFKRSIIQKPPSVPRHLFHGERKLSVYHARLRNNCSSLNYDLFTNHISSSPDCSCGETHETSFHYFFECPNYDNERLRMMTSLDSNAFPKELNVILNGCENLTVRENEVLFEIVQKYIKETKRFSS